MNKKNLLVVRKNIDKIDLKLLNLLKTRTELVKKVILLKKYKKQIVDKKRIKNVLLNIKKNSIKKNIDPKVTNKIWINMIYYLILTISMTISTVRLLVVQNLDDTLP